MGLSVVQDAVGSVERFLDKGRGISAIRYIDWDRRYLWLVEFEKTVIAPPSPFNEFFPASTISINDVSQTKEDFRFGQTHLSIPTGKGTASTMTITFYDDVNKTLQKWFSDWIILDLQNNGKYVSGMDDDHIVEGDTDSFGEYRKVAPVRAINLIYLNLDRSTYEIRKYYIIPDGDFTKDLSQASEAVEHTLSFSIVGEGIRKSGSNDSSITDSLVGALGRLV